MQSVAPVVDSTMQSMPLLAFAAESAPPSSEVAGDAAAPLWDLSPKFTPVQPAAISIEAQAKKDGRRARMAPPWERADSRAKFPGTVRAS